MFVGLVVSLGSSGVVNQLMSGFMLTYSDGLAPGDYVRVGEVEGTVSMLGVLSTKIRTPRNEEVTIPNAVVISGTTINYSRHAEQGVMARTVITIGYDTPWRQVEAMLIVAAERTSGIRKMPPPFVLHTNLSDFYVEYTLLACVDIPELRIPTLATLNANIQDAFNEHGVQIMSPHYVMDPATEKVVPRERWYQAPAKGPADCGGDACSDRWYLPTCTAALAEACPPSDRSRAATQRQAAGGAAPTRAATTVMSSDCGAPAAKARTAAITASTIVAGRRLGEGRQRGDEPLLAEEVVGGVHGLAHAVGEQHERVPRRQRRSTRTGCCCPA